MSNKSNNSISSYLTFCIGEETFAANTNSVLNILEMQKITKVPMAPEHMLGIINLRGMVLPIIDGRVKLGLPPKESTMYTSIIVIKVEINRETVHLGIVVDSVQAVVDIDSTELLPPPSIGNKYKNEFITAISNISEQFILIMDLDALLVNETELRVHELTMVDEH